MFKILNSCRIFTVYERLLHVSVDIVELNTILLFEVSSQVNVDLRLSQTYTLPEHCNERLLKNLNISLQSNGRKNFMNLIIIY